MALSVGRCFRAGMDGHRRGPCLQPAALHYSPAAIHHTHSERKTATPSATVTVTGGRHYTEWGNTSGNSHWSELHEAGEHMSSNGHRTELVRANEHIHLVPVVAPVSDSFHFPVAVVTSPAMSFRGVLSQFRPIGSWKEPGATTGTSPYSATGAVGQNYRVTAVQ